MQLLLLSGATGRTQSSLVKRLFWPSGACNLVQLAARHADSLPHIQGANSQKLAG